MKMETDLHDLSRLCVHTMTTKPWSMEEAATHYAVCGVKGITVWREALAGRNIHKTGSLLRESGFSIVSLCRGGFFAHKDPVKRRKALDDNRLALEEASELGAPLIVLVCGADPAQSLHDSRKQIKEGIEALIPEAAASGIKLAIEPLHPMFADTRSAINTLAQANDMAEAIGSPQVGVAVDVYHLWWDPELEQEIVRCGKNNHLLAFHVSDWLTPTTDFLNDRGLMGKGCIPLKKIRSWVEAAGFRGFIEVEIFSAEYWKRDQKRYLNEIVSAYKKHV
jgi:sugar phosphate isomerase/epimerase